MSKVVVLIELKPEDEFFSRVISDLKRCLPGTRDYPGCLQANLSFSHRRKEVLIHQVWDSIGAVNDYLTWRAERGDLMRISEMLAEEQKYRTFQLAETRAGSDGEQEESNVFRLLS